MDASQHRADAESGKTLVLALVILGMATLLIGSFMLYVSTSQRATSAAEEQTTSHYSADAGIEHAMWRLANESGFAQAASGGSEAYTFELNGQTILVSVAGSTSCREELVNGGFENGIPPEAWEETGPYELISLGAAQAHSGSYYAALGGVAADLDQTLVQSVDLPSAFESATLSYYRYITTLSGDKGKGAQLDVTIDTSGKDFKVEKIKDPVPTGEWQKVTYPWNKAPDFAGQTIQVHFRFQSDLKKIKKGNYTSVYLDDVSLSVCGQPELTLYLIESRAGDKVMRARVRIENGNPVILSWEIDP